MSGTLRRLLLLLVVAGVILATVVVAVARPWASLGPPPLASEPMVTERVIAPTAASIHRDCGFSAVLHDGRSLRAWCDTLVWNEETESGPVRSEGIRWMVNSSWSLSEEGDPYKTGEGTREELLPDDPELCARNQVSWPQSLSVLDRSGDRTRLLVLYDTECRDGPTRPVGTGVAVFEYRDGVLDLDWHDADAFEHDSYSAALSWRDGRIYLFACGNSEPCRLARAEEEELTDPARHEWWTGEAWTPDPSHAVELWRPDFFGAPMSPMNGDVNVTHVPQAGLVVVAYSTFPGYGPMMFRLAREPWGPWYIGREPFGPALCEGTRCYDLIAHEDLSRERELGFTFHAWWKGNRELVVPLRPRGQS